MINAWDCLHFATLELVRSTPIKQRLVSAYRRHLCLVPEEQLPSEARGSFGQIKRFLGGVQPQRGEDAVAASVRKMSSQEADECASLIVEVLGLLSRTQSFPTRAATVVQLHAVETSDDDFSVAALLAHS